MDISVLKTASSSQDFMLTTGTAKAAYYSVAFKKRFKNYCEVIYSRKCYCHIVRTRRVLLRKYQRRQRQAFSLPQRVQRGTGKFEGKNSATEKLPKKGHSVRSHTRLPHHGKNGLLSSPVLSATRPRTWRGKTALAHAATLALPAAVRCGTVRYGTARVCRWSPAPRGLPRPGSGRTWASPPISSIRPAEAARSASRVPHQSRSVCPAPTCFQAPRPFRLISSILPLNATRRQGRSGQTIRTPPRTPREERRTEMGRPEGTSRSGAGGRGLAGGRPRAQGCHPTPRRGREGRGRACGPFAALRRAAPQGAREGPQRSQAPPPIPSLTQLSPCGVADSRRCCAAPALFPSGAAAGPTGASPAAAALRLASPPRPAAQCWRQGRHRPTQHRPAEGAAGWVAPDPTGPSPARATSPQQQQHHPSGEGAGRGAGPWRPPFLPAAPSPGAVGWPGRACRDGHLSPFWEQASPARSVRRESPARQLELRPTAWGWLWGKRAGEWSEGSSGSL